MKKEHFLVIGSSAAAALLVLAIVNWLAPHLLGLPRDLKLVPMGEAVPAFYSGVFRKSDYESADFILQDPLTRVRLHPLYAESLRAGPNDILGFRNRHIPDIADVVVIGDSQTYGNNALLVDNWPSRMRADLGPVQSETYAMAAGGWAAVQYQDMFFKALLFRPRVVIVAFYTGNDSLETFQMVYGNKNWHGLIPNPALGVDDLPRVKFPAPRSEWWPVQFADGTRTIFTPQLRLASNQSAPAVDAGYRVMQGVASYLTERGSALGVQLVFTIVPTKELVYRDKVRAEGLSAPAAYLELIDQESKRIEGLAAHIQTLSGAKYVDVVTPLQSAALKSESLYLEDINAHPVSAGYRVIAGVMAESVRPFLTPRPEGIYAIRDEQGQFRVVLANDAGLWIFASAELVRGNGWSTDGISVLSERDYAALPIRGFISQIDKVRFGPP